MSRSTTVRSPRFPVVVGFLAWTIGGCTPSDGDTTGDAAPYTSCETSSDCLAGQVCCPVYPTGTAPDEAGGPCTDQACFGACVNADSVLVCVGPRDAAADGPAEASDSATSTARDSTVDGPGGG